MQNTKTEYSNSERTPVILPEMEQLLPPLSGEQFSALEGDILENGCYALVIVNEDMVIVDGHNRFRICEKYDLPFKIGGVFLTMANETNFRKDIVATVKANFGKHLPVMDTVIPATVRLAEVSTADKSIFQHEPRGRAAEAYRSLTKEVLEIGHKERSRASDLSR